MSVESPLDVPGRFGGIGDGADELAEFLDARPVEKGRAGAVGDDVAELAARIEAIAVRPDAALDEVLARAGTSLDEAPGLAVTGSTLKATPETTAGDAWRWTTTASDRRQAVWRPVWSPDRGPAPSPGLPHVGPEAVAIGRSQDAPDGVDEGGLAVDAENGVELAGEGGRAGVLADERRAHGHGTRAEAAVGGENGAAQAVGHRPGEAGAAGRLQGSRIGIGVGAENKIGGAGPRGGQ